MKSKLLLIVLSSFLVGCSLFRPKLDEPPVTTTETKYVYANCGSPPRRDEVDFRPADDWWMVLDGRFSLTADDYELLGENMKLIKAGIKQLIVEVEYYEKCLSEHHRRMDQ